MEIRLPHWVESESCHTRETAQAATDGLGRETIYPVMMRRRAHDGIVFRGRGQVKDAAAWPRLVVAAPSAPSLSWPRPRNQAWHAIDGAGRSGGTEGLLPSREEVARVCATDEGPRRPIRGVSTTQRRGRCDPLSSGASRHLLPQGEKDRIHAPLPPAIIAPCPRHGGRRWSRVLNLAKAD